MDPFLERALTMLHEKPDLFVSSYFKDKDGQPLELVEYQVEFIRAGLSRKHPRMCVVAATQCLAKGTKVIMFDGSLKEVQDVKVGDLVMGDDSTARNVIETHSGKDEMYKIIPQGTYAKEYIVNSKHTLALAHRLKHKNMRYENIQLSSFIKKTEWEKTRGYFGYQKPANFQWKDTKLDPYWLGLWLGDGHSNSAQITNMEPEIETYLKNYAEQLGLKLSIYNNRKTAANVYGTVKKTNNRMIKNPITTELRKQNLIKNKHIPKDYLINTREKRLQLLAGIIDTDGTKPKQKEKQNTCEITFVSKRLAEDTVFLARSLGFRTSINLKKTTCQNGYKGIAHRIMLYGELWLIPTKVKRKQWIEQKLFNIPQNYGIRIQPQGVGEYFGFEVDGNHNFLLGDFTVTKNSGKSEMIACLLSLYAIFYNNERIVNISYTEQQARIIFERIKSHLVDDSEEIRALVDLSRSLGSTKEFSKNRMFMKNGTDIRVLSTGTGETDKTGDSILGLESTILNIDESSSIPTTVFYTKILRMLGAKRSTAFQKQLILIGTPQTAGGYFEDAFSDPDYYHMQIDWKRAVEAGRMDEKTVLEQKRKMTKTQFESWYEARFPAMGDDSVFDIEECKRNIVPQELVFKGKKMLGVDVARFGQDITVYMLMDKTKTPDGDFFREVDVLFDDGKDTMQVTGRIADLHKKWKFDTINIDDSGLGCLVAGTEVLTQTGWKKVEELESETLIFSKNENKVTNEHIIQIDKKEAEVIHLENGYSFSKSHFLPLRTRKEYPFDLYAWDRAITFKYFTLDTEFPWINPKEDFDLEGITIKMPHGGTRNYAPPLHIEANCFAKLLGWFLSEGNLDTRAVDITQAQHSRHLKDIEESISCCGLKYTKKLSKTGELKYVIYSTELRNWLAKSCYSNAPYHSQNKKLPNWLKINSKEVIESFLVQYNKGDGCIHHGSREYFSNSKQMAEEVLQLVYKVGKYGNIRIKQKKGSETFIYGRKVIRDHDCYVVYEWKDKVICVYPKVKEIKYQTVYDIHITGESRLYMVRFADKRAFWVHNGGVTDRLKELGLPAFGVIAGAKCTTKEAEETCINLKAELYTKAKRLFEQDRLKILDKGRLLYELRQMKKEFQSNGKIKIIDPEKSPDFVSGLIYSIFEPNVGTFVMIDFSHSANKVKGFGKRIDREA